MSLKHPALVAITILAFLLVSCPDPVLSNQSPSIDSISTGGSTATLGEVKTLTAVASDPDGDTLSYSWDATGGSFSSTTGQTVNWTAPDSPGTIGITLSISDGRNPTVSHSVSITVTIPNAPIQSFVAESRPESALLSWINPGTSNFSSALIRRSTSSYPLEPTEGTEVYSGSNQSFLDTGLVEGTQYYYSAWALNNSGTHSSRVTATATPTNVDTTPPFDVTNLRANTADSLVSLSWDPPYDDDYDYAEISFTPVQAGITQPIKTQRGVNGYNIPGLTNTVEYNFLVRSVDTSGNRSLGATITGRPEGTINLDDQTPPSNVASLQTAQGENELTLSWTAPPESDYAYAEITFSPVQAGVAQPVIVPRGSLSTAIKPLRGGQVFTFTVKSVDFTGNKSAGIAASDLVLDSTAPGDPQSLRFTSTGNGTGTLTWSNPADFDYYRSILSSDLAITGFPRNVTGTTYSLSGLVGLPYTITVKSEDFSGNTSAGTALTFTPSDTTPPANFLNTATYTAAYPGGARIDLFWYQPGDIDFSHVEITFDPEAAGVEQPVLIPKGTTTTSIGNLTNSTSYTFTLKCVDAAGNKSAGHIRTATPYDALPPEVTSLMVASDPFGEKVNCSWVEPTVEDFSHIELTFTPLEPDIEQPITILKGTQDYVLDNLTNGTSYTLVFKTMDLAGNGSTGLSRTVTPTDLPPPDVTSLSATADLDGGIIHLSWVEPDVQDFSHVQLLFSPTVSGVSQPIIIQKGTTTYSQAGLTNGTSYTFTLRSVDEAGNLSSGSIISQTPSNPAPGPVSSVWFNPEPSGGALNLYWVEPASSDFTHVKISFTPTASGVDQPIQVPKGTTSKKISGLTNGTLYTFTIVACDITEAESTGLSRSLKPWNSSEGSYTPGSLGPSGGIIFYDAGNSDNGWRYLEAWHTDEPGRYQWKTTNTSTGGTSLELGTGVANTICMAGTNHPAAQVCRDAIHGGFTDWFLPSIDELATMYSQIATIGMFTTQSNLWSSSESSSNSADAHYLYFYNGQQGTTSKTGSYWIRTIRRF